MNGTFEQHENHHDAEDLKRIAGHVHHDSVHWDLLRRGDGDFPCFFQLEGVGVFGVLRSCLLLLLLLALGSVSRFPQAFRVPQLTCLPPRPLENPGGLGMLDAALVGRGMGEFNATTHSGGGGGGKAADMVYDVEYGIGKTRGWVKVGKKWEDDGARAQGGAAAPQTPP